MVVPITLVMNRTVLLGPFRLGYRLLTASFVCDRLPPIRAQARLPQLAPPKLFRIR